MEQFLDTLSLETLEEIKNSAITSQMSGDCNIDGEAEVEKLLMMHMSKRHHYDEVNIPTTIPKLDRSLNSGQSSMRDIPLTRKESSRKKP